MSKNAILAFVVLLVVAAFWMAVLQNRNSETAVEAGAPDNESAEPLDGTSGTPRGADSRGMIIESGPTPAGMPGTTGPGSLSDLSGGPGKSVQIPPEGLSGDTPMPMGPAPEASDTGVFGPAPEAGDTGIMGPAPEADAIVIENESPEFGQSTEPGLPPEATKSP